MPALVHDALHAVFAAELPFSRRFDWPGGMTLVVTARDVQLDA